MTEQTNKIRVFSNGSQFAAWEDKNCNVCPKSYANAEPKPESGEGECDLVNALGIAYVTDGMVLESIAKRLGFISVHRFTWDCPERAMECGV